MHLSFKISLRCLKGALHSTGPQTHGLPDPLPFRNPGSLTLYPMFYRASRNLPLPHSSYPTHYPILQTLFPKFLSTPSNLLYLHHAHLPWSKLALVPCPLNWYKPHDLDHSQVLAGPHCSQSVFANISDYILIPSLTCLPTVLRVNIAWSSKTCVVWLSSQLCNEFWVILPKFIACFITYLLSA